MDDDNDEEKQPLNAMVTENLKNIIIRKIYKDVERNVATQKKESSPVVRQYLAALGPIIAALSSGMAAGYSAILLPQLMAEDSEIAITKDEGSWIASMLALPLIFGCLVSGYLMDTLGRKMSQIASCIPFTIGWVVLAFSPNVTALYIGRFITGFCVGLISPICQVFIAETSQPEHRGILLSGAPLSVAIGIFLSHMLGTFFSWQVTAGICGIPPAVCVVLLIFAYETPIWLLQKGKIEQAEKSFLWFQGDSEEAIKEFNTLLKKSKNETEEQKEEISKLKLCIKSSFLKPFMVLNFFFLVQQFSGVNAVAFYSIAILKNVMTNMDEYFATLLIDIVRFIVSVIAILLLKRFGRKQLSIASATGTAISLFLLGLYLGVVKIPDSNFASPSQLNVTNETTITTTLKDLAVLNISNDLSDTDVLNFTSLDNNNESLVNITQELIKNESQPFYTYVVNYLPMVFLVVYICFVSIGLVPIPWVLTGELFSKEMRGIGSGGCSSFGFLCYFIVVKLTPDLFEHLGNHGTFFLFGSFSVLGSVILALFLPETKDKTLAEIEAFYSKKKPTTNTIEQNGTSIQS